MENSEGSRRLDSSERPSMLARSPVWYTCAADDEDVVPKRKRGLFARNAPMRIIHARGILYFADYLDSSGHAWCRLLTPVVSKQHG